MSIEELSDRVAELERRQRRMVACFIAIVITFFSMCIIAQVPVGKGEPQADELGKWLAQRAEQRAREAAEYRKPEYQRPLIGNGLIIVDDRGNTRAAIHVDDVLSPESTRLTLHASDGGTGLRIEARKDASTVSLGESLAQPSVEIFAGKNRAQVLATSGVHVAGVDAAERAASAFVMQRKQTALEELAERSEELSAPPSEAQTGNLVRTVMLLDDGTGMVVQEGVSQAFVTSDSFKVYKGSETRAYFGDSTIRLLAPRERTRVSIGKTELKASDTGDQITTATGSIVLFDEDGKVKFRAP